MGIRIHKILGYGLTDLTFEKYTCIDTRINQEVIKNRDEDPGWGTVRDFMRWAVTQATSDLSNPKNIEIALLRNQVRCKAINEDDPLSQFITSDAECCLGNVLVITPISEFESWRRYNDPIDYTEEINRAEGPAQSRIEVIKGGIYPYNAFWDLRTEKPAPGGAVRMIEKVEWLERAYERGKLGKNPEDLIKNTQQLVLTLLNLDSWDDCKKYIRPRPPEGAMLLAEYLDLFTSEDTAKQLQPLLYVYWG